MNKTRNRQHSRTNSRKSNTPMEKQVRAILGHPLACSRGVHGQRVRVLTKAMNRINQRYAVNVWDLQLKHVLWHFTNAIQADCTKGEFQLTWIAVCALAERKKVLGHWAKSMLSAVKPVCARLGIGVLEIPTFKKEKIDPSKRRPPSDLVRFRDIETWQKQILPEVGRGKHQKSERGTGLRH
jgi:hypothetical protein